MFKQLFLVIFIYSSLSKRIICYQDDVWPEPGYEPQVAMGPSLSNEKCDENIYRRCNVPQYTKEDVENVRLFFNYSFMELADVKPDKPLCRKLHVRKDWKCLSEKEKNKIINVWKVLYQKNIIQEISDMHARYWSTWYKTVEFLPSHRWINYIFEKYMRAEDPTVALPYWTSFLYGTHPERASIWDTLGHSGNYSNGYCVTDGIYKDINLVPCLKRHWTNRRTIYPWATLEMMTTGLQTGQTLSEMSNSILGIHFGNHLNIGGDEGQMSIRTAPYEVLFYQYHTSTDNDVLAWQLLDPKHLTPIDYNMNQVFDTNNGDLKLGDIQTDTLTGVPNVTIRETFWIGFGDYCFVPDRLIKPINAVWKAIQTNTTAPNPYIPNSIKRLPDYIKAKYFPLFLSKTISPFASLFEDVGQCNSQCLPLIKPTFMEESWNGKRQYRAYQYDNGLDIGGSINLAEQIVYLEWKDLNYVGYCSPYVTP